MRFKPETYERIDREVHNASLANLSEKGAIDYIHQKTGIRIGRTLLHHRKGILKLRRTNLWNKYRNDDFAYRLEHLARIDEAKYVRDIAMAEMNRYNTGDRKDFYLLQRAAYLVLETNRRIQELTQLIPEIDAVGGTAFRDEIYQEIPSISATQTTSQQDQGNRQF